MKKKIIGLIICISMLPNVVLGAEYNPNMFKGELYNQLIQYDIREVPKIYKVPGYEDKPKSVIGNINYDNKIILIKASRTRKEHIYYHEVAHLIYRQYDLENNELWLLVSEDINGCDIISDKHLESDVETFCELFAYYMDVYDSVYFNNDWEWYNELRMNNLEAYQFIDTLALEVLS